MLSTSQCSGASTILVFKVTSTDTKELSNRIEAEGNRVGYTSNVRQTLAAVDAGIDLLLLDGESLDADAFELLQSVLELDPSLLIIVHARSIVSKAVVEAIHSGARCVVSGSSPLDEVERFICRLLESREAPLAPSSFEGGALDAIVGESKAIRDVKSLIVKIARSHSSMVLITGESGTGKDLTACTIHALSDRSKGPFVAINCSTLTSSLLESELFGHEEGAFTDAKQKKRGLLELAHGGTAFLDEISEMDASAQAKLLRFLEDKTFRRVGGMTDVKADVRIVAATNVDLTEAIEHRRFREDLYYRLAVLTICIPPLRVRLNDLDLLVNYFVKRFNIELDRQVRSVTPRARRHLRSYDWPGNVRELRNSVERAMVLTDKRALDVEDFQLHRSIGSSAQVIHLPPEGINFRGLERSLVEQALERAAGNKSRAASLLGFNRDQIRYRIEKFGLANTN